MWEERFPLDNLVWLWLLSFYEFEDHHGQIVDSNEKCLFKYNLDAEKINHSSQTFDRHTKQYYYLSGLILITSARFV